VAIYSHEKYLSTDLEEEKGDCKAAQRNIVSCRKESTGKRENAVNRRQSLSRKGKG
jgi:hypothetical protein